MYSTNLIEQNMLKTTEERKRFILDRIAVNAKGCLDGVIEMGKIVHVGPDGYHRVGPGMEKLPFTNYAESQLLGRLNVQASYVHRCPSWLQAANVNHWINENSQKKILLRWKNDIVRAVFSTRFKPELDDQFLFPVVLEGLEKACDGDLENLHIREFCQEDDFTLMRSFFKNCKVEIENETYYAGVSVVNSEVGKSSIYIRPTIRGGNARFGVYDYLDRHDEGCLAIRHVSELDVGKIVQGVKNALVASQVGIHRLLATGQEQITKPLDEIAIFIENANFISQRVAALLEDEYRDNLLTTKLNLARSVLKAVKTLPLFQRYLAEQEVGRYLGLFQATKDRAKSILEEIKDVEEIAP